MEYKLLLTQLIKRQDLSEADAADAVDQILSGAWTEGQIGAFLGALACKGEAVDEVAGAARAMRRKAIHVQAIGQVVMDTCGTGGDGSNTFNISTTTAFVVAGAGVAVAKHGNRSISSLCGSADVLEALGMKLSVAPESMEQALNEIGICFMFAPSFEARHASAQSPRRAHHFQYARAPHQSRRSQLPTARCIQTRVDRDVCPSTWQARNQARTRCARS